MSSIGKLARKYSLSRSTLLYYDRIGILKPSARTKKNYRVYNDEDERRLKLICTFRKTGLSLDTIRKILETSGSVFQEILINRFNELNEEIKAIEKQKRFILDILKGEEYKKYIGDMNRDKWIAILRSCGYDEMDMIEWHREFEKHSPENHLRFLKSMGVPENEIDIIRQL